MPEMEVTEQELQGLYTWVDEIPLSRPKRNIGRDFSDGVLMAEVIHHYIPKLVELHNYSSANSTQQKMYNWNTLNQKVFKRMGFTVSRQDFESICNCNPGSIERVLKLVKMKIAKCIEEGFSRTASIPLAAPGPAKPYTPTAMDQPHQIATMPKGYGNAPMAQGYAAASAMEQMPMASLASRIDPWSRPAAGVGQEVLAEKDQTISELRETNEILENKVRKLEQLVRLKDAKIQTLMAKLSAAGLA